MREDIITEIDAERARQDDAWGGPEPENGHDSLRELPVGSRWN